MADEVLTAREGAVLRITLNRPDVYNAINREMHAGLAAALEEAADPEVRAVVLTGAGRGFCAGQDLREFQELPGGVQVGARGDVPPERPRDPCAREARGSGDQRRLCGGGALARLRVRRADCVLGCELRAGLHRDRARPRRGRHVVHPPPARVREGVRVDDLQPPARRGRGSRLGSRVRGRAGATGSRRESRSSAPGTRRFRPAASRARRSCSSTRSAPRSRISSSSRPSCSTRPRRPRTSARACRRSSRSALRTSAAASPHLVR